MARIRAAIVGTGNCASALAQGLAYYRDGRTAGLITETLGGYDVRDIEIVAAFDAAAEKVGVDLADALAAAPNNTRRFARLENMGVAVARGPTLDGFGRYLMTGVREAAEDPVDVAAHLASARAEVLVSYLPVGAEEASAFYAMQALKARCAFVNCMPAFIASTPAWAARFAAAGLPIIGDDVKSQLGATVLHRTLVQLLAERGVALKRTYQLNVGGNSDFRNMLEQERLASKKISKTRAVASLIEGAFAADDVHVGPSDFVPWLEDRKIAFVRLEAEGFGGAPIEMEVRLSVWDSPNSAAAVIDAIRYARIALDRGIGGPLEAASAALMKSPPRPMGEAQARAAAAAFASGA